MNRIETHKHILKLGGGVSIEAETTDAESPFTVEENRNGGVSIPISDIENQLLAQGISIMTTWNVS